MPYPVTDEFEAWWNTTIVTEEVSETAKKTYEVAKEILGTYEHGTADIEDLFTWVPTPTEEETVRELQVDMLKAFRESAKEILYGLMTGRMD